MAESYGMTAGVGVGGISQLLARNDGFNTRKCLLAMDAAIYLRGCAVFAASVDGPFARVLTAALPAATDVVGIVAEDSDATLEDRLSVMFVHGEFVKEAVIRSSGVIDAAGILALEEALLARGMNLVPQAYGDLPGAI